MPAYFDSYMCLKVVVKLYLLAVVVETARNSTQLLEFKFSSLEERYYLTKHRMPKARSCLEGLLSIHLLDQIQAFSCDQRGDHYILPRCVDLSQQTHIETTDRMQIYHRQGVVLEQRPSLLSTNLALGKSSILLFSFTERETHWFFPLAISRESIGEDILDVYFAYRLCIFIMDIHGL